MLTGITQLKTPFDVLKTYSRLLLGLRFGKRNFAVLNPVDAFMSLKVDADVNPRLRMIVTYSVLEGVLKKSYENQRCDQIVARTSTIHGKLDRNLVVEAQPLETDIVLHVLNLLT